MPATSRPRSPRRALLAGPVVSLALLCAGVATRPAAAAIGSHQHPATASSTATIDAAFVNAAFHDFVAHGPSASSKSYWTGRLVSGATSRAGLVSYLASSAASARVQVIELYGEILGRAPSDAALASWASQISSHRASATSIAITFLSSNEFYQRVAGGSTEQWARQLYWILLGNASPTTAQVSSWTNVANSHGLAVAALDFYESAGPRSVRVSLLYHRLLHRAPSGASLAHWVDVDRSGDLAVAVPLAESGEYLTVAQTRNDARETSPLSAVAHVGTPTSVPVTTYTYLQPPNLRVYGAPPGLTLSGSVTFQLSGTPTRAGTYHVYLILWDDYDAVVDTLTITVLA